MNQDIDEKAISFYEELKPIIDYHIILKNIQEGKKAKKLAKNRPIILLLGPTGSGKSTTANNLIDNKMEFAEKKELIFSKYKDEYEETTVYKIELSDEQFVTVFEIGHSKESHTRVIQVSEMNPQTEYLICDCPGFFDSRKDFEIPHAVNLKRFLSSCKSVRPVVLISYDTIKSTKGHIFKEQLDIIVDILDQDENVDKFLFLYTHVPDNINYKNIKSEHQSLEQKLQDEPDDNSQQIRLLNVLKDQLELHKGDLIINPLMNKDNYFKIIKKQPPFENPSKQFRIGLSKNAKQNMELFVQKIQNKINYYLAKDEYKEIIDLLHILKKLIDSLENSFFPYLNESYIDFQNILEKSLAKKMQEAIDEIKQEDSVLNKRSILRIKEIQHHLQLIDKHTDSVLQMLTINECKFIDDIKKECEKIQELAIQNLERDLQKSKACIQNLQLISEQVIEVEQTFKQSSKNKFGDYSKQLEKFFEKKTPLPDKEPIQLQINQIVSYFNDFQYIENLLSPFFIENDNKLHFYQDIIYKSESSLKHYFSAIQNFTWQKSNEIFRLEQEKTVTQPESARQSIHDNSILNYSQNILSFNSKDNNMEFNLECSFNQENYSINSNDENIPDYQMLIFQQLDNNEQFKQHLKQTSYYYKKAQNCLESFQRDAFQCLVDVLDYKKSKKQMFKIEEVIISLNQIKQLDEASQNRITEQYSIFQDNLKNTINKQLNNSKLYIKIYYEEQIKQNQVKNLKQKQKNDFKLISKKYKFFDNLKYVDKQFKFSIIGDAISKIKKYTQKCFQHFIDRSKFFAEEEYLNSLYFILESIENLKEVKQTIEGYEEKRNDCIKDIQESIFKKFQKYKQDYSKLEEDYKDQNDILVNTWKTINNNLVELDLIQRLNYMPDTKSEAEELSGKFKKILEVYFKQNNEYIQENLTIDKIKNLNQNEMRKQRNFIQNIMRLSEYEKIQNSLQQDFIFSILDDLNVNFEKLVPEYLKITKNMDLQSQKEIYEKIKSYIQSFKKIYPQISDDFNNLPDPQEQINQTIFELHQYCNNHEYDRVQECLDQLQQVSSQECNIKKAYSILYKQFEKYSPQVVKYIQYFKNNEIKYEYVKSLKKNLDYIDEIQKIFSRNKQVEESKILEKIQSLKSELNQLFELKITQIKGFSKKFRFQLMEE